MPLKGGQNGASAGQGLEVTGGVPPSRSGFRLASQGGAGSNRLGSRAGTRHGATAAQKETLCALLMSRMRDRFRILVNDPKVQEVIGQEVVSYVNNTDRPTESDASVIEERIRTRLLVSSQSNRSESSDTYIDDTQAPPARVWKNPHAVSDEWATIMKYESEMDHRAAQEARVREAEQRRKMRTDLDNQVMEQAMKKKWEEQQQAEFAEQENMALAQWKAQERRKMEERRRTQLMLKEDRDRQLREHEEARQRAEEERKMEDHSLRRQALMDNKRTRQLEEKMKRTNMEFMAKLKLADEETKRIRQDMLDREAMEEMAASRKFAEDMQKQDRERRAGFERMQEEQERRLKSLMKNVEHSDRVAWDDALIEKHTAIKEQMFTEADLRKKKRDEESKLEMRRVLALQLRDREERMQKQKEADQALMDARQRRLEAEIAEEERIKRAATEQRLAHRKHLEAQIRDNASRKDSIMDSVERALNSNILVKVKDTLGVVI